MKTGTETTTNPAATDWLLIGAILVAAILCACGLAALAILVLWVWFDRLFGKSKQ